MKIRYVICALLCVLFSYMLVACGGTQIDEYEPQGTTQNGANHIPARRPEFHSMSDIKAFLEDDSSQNAESLGDNIGLYVTDDEAADIYNTADMRLYPVASLPDDSVEMHATWYTEKNSLDIVYVIDDVQYRFLYFFGLDYQWESEEGPIAQGVKLGPYTVDFWAQESNVFDARYYGYIKLDDVYVAIIVMGDGLDAPSFDDFRFVPLSSIDGEESI